MGLHIPNMFCSLWRTAGYWRPPVSVVNRVKITDIPEYPHEIWKCLEYLGVFRYQNNGFSRYGWPAPESCVPESMFNRKSLVTQSHTHFDWLCARCVYTQLYTYVYYSTYINNIIIYTYIYIQYIILYVYYIILCIHLSRFKSFKQFYLCPDVIIRAEAFGWGPLRYPW